MSVEERMTFEQARDAVKLGHWPKDVDYNCFGDSPREAFLLAVVTVAMEMIGNYQSDIANTKTDSYFSNDETLEQQGFCQGDFYKDCQKLLKPWERRLT